MRNIVFVFLISLFVSNVFASKLDSLISLSGTVGQEELANVYNQIAREYIRIDLDWSLKYSDKAIKKSLVFDNKTELAQAYLYKSVIYKKKHDYDNSKVFYLKTIEVAEQIPDTSFMSKSYYGLGQIEFNTANFDAALDYINKSILLKKESGDLKGEANSYNTVGNIYLRQSDNENAIKNYQKALKIFEKIGFKQGVAASHNSIGLVYENLANYNNVAQFKEAMGYYKQALEIYIELNIPEEMANSYSNIGNVYAQYYEYYLDKIKKEDLSEEQKNKLIAESDSIYILANDNSLKALELREEIGDYRGVSSSNINLSALCITGKNYKQAEFRAQEAIKFGEKIDDPYMQSINYYYLANVKLRLRLYNEAKVALDKSIDISKKMNLKKTEMQSYRLYSDLYDSLGDYKNAFFILKEYIVLKDTIHNEESAKVIEDLNKKYQTEKKEQDLKIANAEINQKDLENSRQKLMIYGFGIVIILIIAFAIFVFRQYKEKKKANDVLAAKNDLITKQKKEITDSIQYAKRIQTAILPQGDYIDKISLDRFILFKPKDIVSGDYYWIKDDENGEIIYVTAADCTGHGVPGAFMSMLGVSFLNEIINRPEVKHTGTVLDSLRESVITSLHQTGRDGEAKDGMDISFIALNKQKMTLEFSGANNPIYIIRENNKQAIECDKSISNDTHTLYEIKGDKMPIGIYRGRSGNFKTINIKLEKGDSFYLFSDGYPDQFGGPSGKKFKYKPFKNMILDNVNKTMDEQRAILDNEFYSWKGELEQVDDIIVIGIRV